MLSTRLKSYCFALIFFTYPVLVRAGQFVNIISYAVPGDAILVVKDHVLQHEVVGTTTEIAIVEGGLNDIYWFGSSAPNYYRQAINAIHTRLSACGVSAFYQQLTPIIPEIIDADAYTGRYAPILPKVQGLNLLLDQFATSNSLTTINVYDAFSEFWTADGIGYCLIDGTHLSALGAQKLAELWWVALSNEIIRYHLIHPNEAVQIAIYGDSIPAAAYLPINQRPPARLEAIATQALSLAKVQSWELYE